MASPSAGNAVAVANGPPQAGRRPGARGALPAAMVSTSVASLQLAPARHEDERGRNAAADGASNPRAQMAVDDGNESDGPNGSGSDCIRLFVTGQKPQSCLHSR